MKTLPMVVVLLAGGVASRASQVTAVPALGNAHAVLRWEYRVLTKEQVLDLGKKDLTAGLNQLGGEGWELAAIDGVYIFKRPKDQSRGSIEDLKNLVAIIESDVELWKDRVAWAERMLRKGYLSDQQVKAERAILQRTQMALGQGTQRPAGFLSRFEGTR